MSDSRADLARRIVAQAIQLEALHRIQTSQVPPGMTEEDWAAACKPAYEASVEALMAVTRAYNASEPTQ